MNSTKGEVNRLLCFAALHQPQRDVGIKGKGIVRHDCIHCQGCATMELMHIWDYREKDLKKTEWGRRYILQNMINMGPGRRKISLKLVKKYWKDLDIDPLRRNLLRYLIWGKR